MDVLSVMALVLSCEALGVAVFFRIFEWQCKRMERRIAIEAQQKRNETRCGLK